jgi:hypothetical protein
VTPTIGFVTMMFGFVSLDPGHVVTCNRLFRIAVRIGGSRSLSQLYVGKRPISKGIGGAIRRFGVFALRGLRYRLQQAWVRVARSTAEPVAIPKCVGAGTNC